VIELNGKAAGRRSAARIRKKTAARNAIIAQPLEGSEKTFRFKRRQDRHNHYLKYPQGDLG